MIKFLHTADLHLDSPLKGLSHHPHAPVDKIRGASRTALTHLVSLALHEAVNFIIIAGDIYDGNWTDYRTAQFFNSQMRRLQEKNIPVYLLYGNHDAESKITRDLNLPENVHIFSTSEPQTYTVNECAISLHGQGFATQHVHDRLINDYPTAIKDHFNIGVLHTQVEGQMNQTGHAPYAPCTLQELSSKGYDYWALGHVHKQGVLQESPKTIYAGIPQGRHIKETGEKGCYINTIDTSLSLSETVFHPMETLRWEQLTVDLSSHPQFTSWDEIENELVQTITSFPLPPRVNLTVFRIALTGSTGAHETLNEIGFQLHLKLQERLINMGYSEQYWIESIRNLTAPIVDITALREADPLADFVLTNWEEHTFSPTTLSAELQGKLGLNLLLKEPDTEAQELHDDTLLPTKAEVQKLILSTLKSATTQD